MSEYDTAFSVEILPSALTDIIRGKLFYDSIEEGVGDRFRDYVVSEIDSLATNAGIDPLRLGYFCRIANRFHQIIYYKVNGSTVTVWRVLDQRFNPRKVRLSLLAE